MSDKDFVTSPDATIKMELLSSRIAWFATNQNDKELLPKIVGLASTILTSCIHFFKIGGFQLRKLVNIHFQKNTRTPKSPGEPSWEFCESPAKRCQSQPMGSPPRDWVGGSGRPRRDGESSSVGVARIVLRKSRWVEPKGLRVYSISKVRADVVLKVPSTSPMVRKYIARGIFWRVCHVSCMLAGKGWL